MAAEKSYARLGLFLVVALVVVLATAVFFIQRVRKREVIPMVTYTRDNVAGLDVSSPVRLKGVLIGRVANVGVDPRAAAAEIDFEVFPERLITIGVQAKRIAAIAHLHVLEKLRARVVSNPVTGEAYLLIDEPENPPPPIELGFTPDRPYIPSMPTTLATVQSQLPPLIERAEGTLQTLREIVTKMPESLDRSNQFFTNVERILQESHLPEVSADSRKFLTMTIAQLEQIDQITSAQNERLTSELNRLIETREAFAKLVEDTHASIKAADLPATSQSARDTLDRASLAADDLRRSLPAMRDSLEQLRQLARLLEEQPESVVYGPRPVGVKPK